MINIQNIARERKALSPRQIRYHSAHDRGAQQQNRVVISTDQVTSPFTLSQNHPARARAKSHLMKPSYPWTRLVIAGVFVVGSMIILAMLFRTTDTPTSALDTITKEIPIALPTEISSETTDVLPTNMWKTPLTLHIFAHDDVWLQVKIEDAIYFEGVFLRGMTESWNVEDSVNIKVGDVSKIDVIANDEVFHSSAYREDRPFHMRVNAVGLRIIPKAEL